MIGTSVGVRFFNLENVCFNSVIDPIKKMFLFGNFNSNIIDLILNLIGFPFTKFIFIIQSLSLSEKSLSSFLPGVIRVVYFGNYYGVMVF